MNCNLYFTVVNLLLFSFCVCELSVGQKEKILNSFKDYYNNVPNRLYTCNEGFLRNTQQLNDTTYQIVVDIKVTDISNVDVIRALQCIATVQDVDSSVSVTSSICQEPGESSYAEASQAQSPETQVEVTERTAVKLDNEVQEAAITSGEQFIAVPRYQPSAPCVGCSLHVNTRAAGVNDLANLGVRHLDLHEPSVKHSLDTVLDVERQVQVVNGVRYIFTMLINFDKCSEQQSENCASSKICKITILVKPWVKLPNGANYKSILTNNCTEEWQFGDNGEVVPDPSTSSYPGDGNGSDDDIQVRHNLDIHTQPFHDKTLTDEEVKKIQEQIITNSEFQKNADSSRKSVNIEMSVESKQHVFKVESDRNSENSIPATVTTQTEQQQVNINPDKKKTIDDILAYFDFSGFQPKTEVDETIPRIKRSYDYDLQVLSLAEDYHGIKKSIQNAKFMYNMAQVMVDYLNEMDMEIKNRAVKNVIKAEEEIENLQRFIYVQVGVIIPCDKVECAPKDELNQICNGVIDSTNENSPQILNTFCYNDYKERDYRDVINEISSDDPVLQRLAKEALKKIESESTSQYAMKINKIVSANTQVTSGTLTKLSVVIDYIECNKSVPLVLRVNCTVLEHLGSKICEVIIHERHWLKERKISYTCTERPVDMRISKSKSIIRNVTVDDPKITEMLQEAVQYLETQSNKKHKQKIVTIKSISSQVIAGFLTKIEFVVGYTNCTNENDPSDESSQCDLIMKEGLRLCKAQIWDRSWIMDGRQIEVSCDDIAKSNEIEKTRKKRSIEVNEDLTQNTVIDENLKYMKLANESLFKFLHTSSSVQHYKVVKIDKYSVQNVPGTLIQMAFSISPTNCQIQSDGLLSSPKCDIVNPKNIFQCRSKILKNGWVGKTQFFVNCNTKDKEQQINTRSNEIREHNVSESKYYLLAEESMKKYLHDTGNLLNHHIVQVQRVTTQIISGLLTSIDFTISTKNDTDNAIRCHSKILEKHWLDTKEFSVTCQSQKNKNGLIDDKPGNPRYMQVAVECLQKFIKKNPDSHLVRVTFVDKVAQEGEFTKINFLASRTEDDDGDTYCYAEYTEQKLLRNDINVECYSIGPVSRIIQITEKDPKYYQYVQLADESLNHYLHNINSSTLYTIINIENITVQWEEGIKTIIQFIASPIDLDNSELQAKRCYSRIREQSWLHTKYIDVECDGYKDLYRAKREIASPEYPRHITTHFASRPIYKELAEESLRKYVQDSGSAQSLVVLNVKKVSTQIVSGTLTRIDFVASSGQSSDSNTINCHSEVLERPWLKSKEINVSCQNNDQRAKRDTHPGGQFDQNPTDPKYKALAKESLRKYVQDSGNAQSLVVLNVKKVSTQIVSGTLTRIDFVASSGQASDSNTINCHSEVWERPWLKSKEINVSCQNNDQRAKRDTLPGGQFDQNPTDPEYKALAEESLRKYVQDSGNAQSLVVLHVEKVITQIVAGTLTRIDFVASSGQASDSNTINCHSEVWERPWLKSKEINVSCQNNDQRAKRDTHPGGQFDQNPTDPKYKALAEESLRKYVQDSGNAQSLVVLHVEKVITQIVAGTLTRIDFVASSGQASDSNTINCHSEVWERPWLKSKEINVSCQNNDQRAKRDTHPGGQFDQNPTDPKYKALAEESLRKYVQDSGNAQSLVVLNVKKVSTQIVSGTLTRIDFVASSGQASDSNTINCHSEVWERPWLKSKEINVSCQNNDQRAKRDTLPGGQFDQNPTDPEYKALAEESLRKYVQDSGNAQSLVVLHVEKVSTQIVSGTLTRIDFVASSGQASDSNTINCHSEVWERPWLKSKEINVSCQNNDQRAKRDTLPGGQFDQNPTDPEYKALAEESLRKYVQDSGNAQSLVVLHVEKVITQIVAGTLTRIDFVASSGQASDSNTINCHSEVWERPWLKSKEINVSCQNNDQRAKRDTHPGGQFDQNPTDPKYKALAEESLRKYVQDSGNAQSLVVLHVEKVITQIVAGTLTRIDFVASSGQASDSNTINCHSEVWERPWLKSKEINVSCQNNDQRAKRDTHPGGQFDQNPTDPKYKALAEESLRKYVQDSGNAQSLVVLNVKKVSTQIVSGTLTRIDFVASSGQASDSNTINCHSEVWERPWLKSKEINVSCQNNDQRAKRDTLPGGQFDQNPTDPEYKALAEESLRKYVQDSGNAQSLVVLHVEKVSTQIVSGTLTRIDFVASSGQASDSNTINCHSEVWERPWLKSKEINVSCQNNDQRAKRDTLPGGQFDQNPTDPKYKALAEESLRKYVQDSGNEQSLVVLNVKKVGTQIVSGTLTRIDFVASSGQASDSNTINCHSEVWERPWLKSKEINVSCQNNDQRAKRDTLPGGQFDQNPADPKYKALAEESLRKYVQDSGVRNPHQIINILNVSTQTVSGLKTFIHFSASPINNPSSVIFCQSDIWEQIWLNKKEITVNCNNTNEPFRNKRELIKGNNYTKDLPHPSISRRIIEKEQDPKKTVYKLLAEESLLKFQLKNDINLKLIEVKRVVTRVVSGLKYKIDFTAALLLCPVNVTNVNGRGCKTVDIIYTCHSEIWDRPWLKQRKIDIQCNAPDDNDFEDYGSDIDFKLKSSKQKSNNEKKYQLLAEEASDKYLAKSNRKYVHKVTKIHSVTENIADGTITKIEFSLSPTTCLRDKTYSANDTCKIKQPIIVLHCNAKIWDRPWLHTEKDINVTCKKSSINKSVKNKRELGTRSTRQISDDDDDMDEDTIYYYADRAVQHVNDNSHSNNLHKLITIHASQYSTLMDTIIIKMYIELAETFCLRHHNDMNLLDCEEMDGLNHRLCFARVWPSPDDELIVRHVSVVCDDDSDFNSVTGLNVLELLRLSIIDLERSPDNVYKLVHQGEPQLIPSLNSKIPFKLNFIVATTNCSKDVNLHKNPFQCYIKEEIPSKACHSFIWLKPETKFIRYINAKCTPAPRSRRSALDAASVALENLEIQKMVTASLEKLEMSSLHRYKQRVLQINSHSTKITSGKVTTIDFDVGYTSCLKYEWIENITSCDFIEHLPRRRCVAQIWERLWIKNGKNIDVNCVDDETPLESHIEFESAEMANELAREALKHIEAKYPHPSKQKVVRIFSLEKQVVAGIHYRMKIEVGLTDCIALSEQTDCKLQNNGAMNKFCRVNVWVRPWTDHPPNFRVSCDFQEGTSHDFYHQVQAEHLFYNFLATYSPSYVNDYSQMQKRFEIFKSNIKKIHEFNVHEKGTATYGVTRYADLTYEEFSGTYMGLKTNLTHANQIPMKKADVPDIKIPVNFDWREFDAVTEVKDQGSCGSCWAFSVTGNIEGQWKMQSGQLVSLSEQELVDCDKLDDGCNGGLPDNAYRAIEQLGGLELESDYPYEASDDKCEFNKTMAKVQINGAVNITTNETQMAQWLVHNGPISIGINANAMQFYMGGISHPWKMLCNPTNLDHGVLIVGYGVKDYPLFHKKLPYWIVKNSWGKSWGEQGYYRVYRGDGTCGVNQMASSAII